MFAISPARHCDMRTGAFMRLPCRSARQRRICTVSAFRGRPAITVDGTLAKLPPTVTSVKQPNEGARVPNRAEPKGRPDVSASQADCSGAYDASISSSPDRSRITVLLGPEGRGLVGAVALTVGPALQVHARNNNKHI